MTEKTVETEENLTGISTKLDLRTRYGVSRKTFNQWIAKVPNLKLEPGAKKLTPAQVKAIIEHLGKP